MRPAYFSQLSQAFSSRSRSSPKTGANCHTSVLLRIFARPPGTAPVAAISLNTAAGKYKIGSRKDSSDIHCFVLKTGHEALRAAFVGTRTPFGSIAVLRTTSEESGGTPMRSQKDVLTVFRKMPMASGPKKGNTSTQTLAVLAWQVGGPVKGKRVRRTRPPNAHQVVATAADVQMVSPSARARKPHEPPAKKTKQNSPRKGSLSKQGSSSGQRQPNEPRVVARWAELLGC